jgi:hypothetical protein
MSTVSIQEFDSVGNAALLASSGAGIGAEGLLKSAAIVHQHGAQAIVNERIYIAATSAGRCSPPPPRRGRKRKEKAPAGATRRSRVGFYGVSFY